MTRCCSPLLKRKPAAGKLAGQRENGFITAKGRARIETEVAYAYAVTSCCTAGLFIVNKSARAKHLWSFRCWATSAAARPLGAARWVADRQERVTAVPALDGFQSLPSGLYTTL